MNRDSIDWQGYIPAITTAFDKKGALDPSAIRQLCQWLAGEKMHGVIALGTQGEWFSLNGRERRQVLQIVSEELKGRMTIIAGCSAFTATEVIANAGVASELGFDGVMVTPPPYACPTPTETFEFYRAIDAGIDLPLCVYNWPPGTNVNMPRELLERLASLDTVVAIKNSTAGFDMNHFLEVFFALNDRVRVFGMPTNELGISLMREHGADGTMGAGAVLGREYPEYFEAIWAGDLELARRLGARLDRVMSDLFNPDYTAKYGSTQGTFKALLNLQGLPGGHTRPPIMDLDEQGLARVRGTLLSLDRLGNEASELLTAGTTS